MAAQDLGATPARSEGRESSSERRTGPKDRRIAAEDRRNAERVADDLNPRRDPELPDRRAAALGARAVAQ